MLIRSSYGLLFLLILACRPAVAEKPLNSLQEYLDACVGVNDFSGSVLVAKDGEIIHASGYGMANLEHDVANTPATKFRIGSITKQFTGMAVLLLQEQGKLKTSDPVSKHFKDAPDHWDPVTVHHLLTHTSGIPSFTGQADYRKKMMLPQTIEEMVARFRDEPLEFEPGDKFEYSNSGYYLLGAIIEQASGKTYEEFVESQIFQALELKDSGYDRFGKVMANRASGYEKRRDGSVHAPYLDMSQPYAAGSLYSTVEDLYRWDRALRRRELLSQDSYDAYYKPEKNNYAYGWSVSNAKGRRTISHGGGINGFLSFILRIPDEELCVVVISNLVPSQPEKMARDMAAIVMGDDYDLPKERKLAKVNPETLERYEGTYRLTVGMVVSLESAGDHLIGKSEGQPDIVFLPESDASFFDKQSEMRIVFDPNKGREAGFTLHSNGQEIAGELVTEEAQEVEKDQTPAVVEE